MYILINCRYGCSGFGWYSVIFVAVVDRDLEQTAALQVLPDQEVGNHIKDEPSVNVINIRVFVNRRLCHCIVL